MRASNIHPAVFSLFRCRESACTAPIMGSDKAIRQAGGGRIARYVDSGFPIPL
jgi:hypothetical protein